MQARVIQLRTHRKNIDRYRGLLETKLSETERQYLEKQLVEETKAMLQLARIHTKSAPNHKTLFQPLL